MIIGVLNQKGGAGKTTISIHIAHALALKGNRVLLIDSDPQGSARDWSAIRTSESLFTVIAIDRPTIHKEIDTLAKGYDHVVIDGAPRVTDLTRSGIMAADLVVVPIQPSPLDIWASEEVVRLINEAGIYKPDLRVALIISRKIVNTAIGREAAGILENFSLPILKAGVSQRVLFAESLSLGSTALEAEPRGAAAKEINAVVDELLTGKFKLIL